MVDALSVTNLSGAHVLSGHLNQLVARLPRLSDLVVVHSAGNTRVRESVTGEVRWIEAPALTSHLAARTIWERLILPRLARREMAEIIFTPNGLLLPGIDLPQVVLAQNPWALVPTLERTASEQAKAVLQRRAYRSAVEGADALIYNSQYMRAAYRENAGCEERRSTIAYQGLNEDTFNAAARAGNSVPRDPMQILCVSAMAPHKGIETLLRALAHMRARLAVPAHLVLAGPWPDPCYEARVEHLISALGLTGVVRRTGFVSRDRLHELYATSAAFALFSTCESFGIPAVEAQAFGTPVVSSDCCAIPEVCGTGGSYVDASDHIDAANRIAELVTNPDRWKAASISARDNAARFHWESVSTPLVNLMAEIS